MTSLISGISWLKFCCSNRGIVVLYLDGISVCFIDCLPHISEDVYSSIAQLSFIIFRFLEFLELVVYYPDRIEKLICASLPYSCNYKILISNQLFFSTLNFASHIKKKLF